MSADSSNSKLLGATEAPKWTLEVYNVMNSKKIMERNVTGNSCILDASLLNSGIYVLRAIFEGYIYERKIHKR